jgi:hypothetical protein
MGMPIPRPMPRPILREELLLDSDVEEEEEVVVSWEGMMVPAGREIQADVSAQQAEGSGPQQNLMAFVALS